jgi:hypothetical protein
MAEAPTPYYDASKICLHGSTFRNEMRRFLKEHPDFERIDDLKAALKAVEALDVRFCEDL